MGRLEGRHDSPIERRLARDQAAGDRRAAGVLGRHPRSARIVGLLSRVAREQSEERIGLAASGAAFWFAIMVFPAAIAAVNIFGLLVSPEAVAKDLGSIASSGPDSLGSNLSTQLHRVASAGRTGLSVGLAVSVVAAVWTASAGVYNLARAIRVAYGLGPDRYVRARLRALLGAFGVVVSLGLVALISGGVSALLESVPAVLVGIVGIPLLIATMTVIVGATYRFSIDAPVSARRLAPGALFSSVGVVSVSAGFGVYVAFSAHYTAVYGAVAGVAIAMIAAYLAIYVILIGAVINVQLARKPMTEDH